MNLLKKWHESLIKARPGEQRYRNDQLYAYLLVHLYHTGEKYTSTYSTSSPLGLNHTIVLAEGKAFWVKEIVHVVYPANTSTKLSRPTTFVHVGIEVHTESLVNEADLIRLEFKVTLPTFPYRLN